MSIDTNGPDLPFTFRYNAEARLVIAAIRATRKILEAQTVFS
tara:strand:+ start:119 stop:244 length:126 start_codon:yes stop_codon:yes gene_type:complete